MLGPLAAPARGADTGPGLINPFEHHLQCRSCCAWFPPAQGCRGLLNPAGLRSSLGSSVTRSRCLSGGMQGRRAGRCLSRHCCPSLCQRNEPPLHTGRAECAEFKDSLRRTGSGGEAGKQWGAVSAALPGHGGMGSVLEQGQAGLCPVLLPETGSGRGRTNRPHSHPCPHPPWTPSGAAGMEETLTRTMSGTICSTHGHVGIHGEVLSVMPLLSSELPNASSHDKTL